MCKPSTVNGPNKCWLSGLEFTKYLLEKQTGKALIRLLLQKQSDLGLLYLSWSFSSQLVFKILEQLHVESPAIQTRHHGKSMTIMSHRFSLTKDQMETNPLIVNLIKTKEKHSFLSPCCKIDTAWSLYHTPLYKINLDITRSCHGAQNFSPCNLQRNNR